MGERSQRAATPRGRAIGAVGRSGERERVCVRGRMVGEGKGERRLGSKDPPLLSNAGAAALTWAENAATLLTCVVYKREREVRKE